MKTQFKCLVRYISTIDGLVSGFASKADKVTSEILSFLRLPQGWDFGMGDPIDRRVVDIAVKIHEIGVIERLQTEATPEVDGGITLTFVSGENCLDVRINQGMTFDITIENGIGPDYQEILHRENVSLAEIRTFILNLKPDRREQTNRCESSEVSGQIDTAQPRSVLKRNRVLKITKTASPLLNKNVFSAKQGKYAYT